MLKKLSSFFYNLFCDCILSHTIIFKYFKFQNINDMCQLERPDWQQVMAYVTVIYKHFET